MDEIKLSFLFVPGDNWFGKNIICYFGDVLLDGSGMMDNVTMASKEKNWEWKKMKIVKYI